VPRRPSLHRIVAGALAAVLVCLPLSARAEDDAPVPVPAAPPESPVDPRAQVAAWLQELTSASFQTREAARAQLEREGLRARDLLEAAREHPDAEVRRTVEAILARSPGARREPAATIRHGDFEALGRITLQLEKVTRAQALRAVGEQMGGHFELPGAPSDLPLSLRLTEKPAYAALAALLDVCGLRMPGPFDADGQAALVEPVPDAPVLPWAAAGPTRVQLQEVSATRTFDKDVAPRYLVRLRLDWAPFVQVAQYGTPRIESAFDPDGKPFLPSPDMTRVVRRGVGTRSRSTPLDLHLLPGKEGCRPEVAVLTFSLPLTLRYDLAEVVLADTAKIPVSLDTSGAAAKPDVEGSVTFHSLELVDERQGQWVAEYSVRLQSEIAQRTVEAYVIEEGGARTQLYVAGGRSRSADGTVRITARAYRGQRGRPKGLVVRWHRREEEGELRYRVTDIPLR
jgi:hypothetical protein